MRDFNIFVIVVLSVGTGYVVFLLLEYAIILPQARVNMYHHLSLIVRGNSIDKHSLLTFNL